MEHELPKDLSHPRDAEHSAAASIIVGVFMLAVLGTLIWFWVATGMGAPA